MKNRLESSGAQLKLTALLAGVFCVFLMGTASAEQEGGRPCSDDAAKLCKGVKPGEGRIVNCLKEHKDQLSPACKEHIAKAKDEVKEAKEACHDEIQKLCKGIRPGGGRIVQCLRQHESELTPACKEHISKPRGRM